MSPIDLIIRALGILFGLGILVLSFIFGAFILMTIVGLLILAVIGFLCTRLLYEEGKK